jgi:hypothetical protein
MQVVVKPTFTYYMSKIRRLAAFFAAIALANRGLAEEPHWKILNTGPSQNVIETLDGSYLLIHDLGVEKSIDAGRTWTWTSYNPIPRSNYNATGGAAVSPFGIFVGSVDQGIWRSTDDGNTWAQTFLTGFGTGSANMVSDGNTLLTTYGGFLRGIYKWNGLSQTWEFKYSPPPSVDCCSADFYSFAKDSQGGIYSSAQSPNHFGGVFKSTDEGETWNNVLPTRFLENPGALAWWNGRIVATRNNLGVVASADFGLTWITYSPIPSTVESPFVTDLKVGPDGLLYASVFGVGVERTSDLHTWENVSHGLPSLATKKLSVIGGKLFVATEGGLAELSTNETELGDDPASAAVPEPSQSVMLSGSVLIIVAYCRVLLGRTS